MGDKMRKIIIGLILMILALFVGLVAYLSISDYDPALRTEVDIDQKSEIIGSSEFVIATWNIGYTGLGAETDFFMDGGTSVQPTKEHVNKNLKGVLSTISDLNADIYFLQEIDINSKRSYGMDLHNEIADKLPAFSNTYAMNYDVDFVPIPAPPIGKVKSGISTFSKYQIDEAIRIGFEVNYTWPKKIMHLDRCLSVNELSIAGKNSKLILINLHLSAYDSDGGLRSAQLKRLKEVMDTHYKLGNYVIAGGDFNQVFPNADNSKYPILFPEIYIPESIDSDYLDAGWSFIFDTTHPTYRLLSAPYDKDIAQVGVIDGFIISPNVEVIDVETVNQEFAYSDHQPVVARFKLK